MIEYIAKCLGLFAVVLFTLSVAIFIAYFGKESNMIENPNPLEARIDELEQRILALETITRPGIKPSEPEPEPTPGNAPGQSLGATQQ